MWQGRSPHDRRAHMLDWGASGVKPAKMSIADAAVRPWSQRAQIFRHIAKLLQYNRVRKLANVRIACTLECDRPRIGRIA